MNELIGNSPEVEAKEILFTEIFDQIAKQNFGEGDENIQVEENHFSSAPEVTKSIALRRTLGDEELQRNIYKALGIQERPKDTDMRYLIMQEVNDQFKLISIRRSIEDGRTYFEKAQDDENIEGDRDSLTNIARDIKDTLAFEVERLEK